MRKRQRYVYVLVEWQAWERDRVLSHWSSYAKAEREKNRLLSVVNGGYSQLCINQVVIA